MVTQVITDAGRFSLAPGVQIQIDYCTNTTLKDKQPLLNSTVNRNKYYEIKTDATCWLYQRVIHQITFLFVRYAPFLSEENTQTSQWF